MLSSQAHFPYYRVVYHLEGKPKTLELARPNNTITSTLHSASIIMDYWESFKDAQDTRASILVIPTYDSPVKSERGFWWGYKKQMYPFLVNCHTSISDTPPKNYYSVPVRSTHKQEP